MRSSRQFLSVGRKVVWFNDLGMDTYLDYMVSSYDIRKLKDMPETYQACLDLMHIKADETVFLGHQYEMIGARVSKIASIAVMTIASREVPANYKIDSLAELPDLIKEINHSLR